MYQNILNDLLYRTSVYLRPGGHDHTCMPRRSKEMGAYTVNRLPHAQCFRNTCFARVPVHYVDSCCLWLLSVEEGGQQSVKTITTTSVTCSNLSPLSGRSLGMMAAGSGISTSVTRRTNCTSRLSDRMRSVCLWRNVTHVTRSNFTKSDAFSAHANCVDAPHH